VQAEVVAIGSELLLGQIVDTNSAVIARHFTSIGLDLFYKTTVGDNLARTTAVIRQALDRSDVVVTTGGIGPTADDITREAVAAATGRELVFSEELTRQIETYFTSRGFRLSPSNRRQAYIPAGALPVENPVGTAPAFIVADHDRTLITLPGVPREMEYLLVNRALPYLRERYGIRGEIRLRVLKCVGLGESRIGERLADFMEKGANPTVGTLAHLGQVDVRIAAKAADKTAALKLIAPVEAEVRELLGSAIFAADDETMEHVVGKLLRERNRTVAACEDLTSGLLADRLNTAGLDRFGAGFICNGEASMRALVKNIADTPDIATLLEDHVALTDELARAARELSGCDLGLALHAVADPTTEVQNLARGETYIALTDGRRTVRRESSSAGRGAYDRSRMTLNAMDLLRTALIEGMG
jgi:nicotinamide-nucleotide amidase